jgi:hypothetical protein
MRRADFDHSRELAPPQLRANGVGRRQIGVGIGVVPHRNQREVEPVTVMSVERR